MSDVNVLRALADCDGRAGEPLGKAMRSAADEIERLQAELREARELLEHIDAQLPSWLDAMSDWELGGDIALESMDSARARIDAFLAKRREK